MSDRKKTELLAPAGSVETMRACFAAGADAVYMGLPKFGARAYAENADQESYVSAINEAHLSGKMRIETNSRCVYYDMCIEPCQKYLARLMFFSMQCIYSFQS